MMTALTIFIIGFLIGFGVALILGT